MRIEALNGALHQWDTGRQIEVICDEGCTLDYVEFSHHRSPSPIRVAPDAGNVVSIPDELLRHSGMLMVSAIVIDARGKDFAHSACLCTEAAVRPKDYNGGGGSGGSGGGVRIDARASDDWETVVANVTHGDLKQMIEAGEFPDGVYTETWIEPSGNEIIERVERIVLAFFNPEGDGSIIVVSGTGNGVSFPVNGEPFVS